MPGGEERVGGGDGLEPAVGNRRLVDVTRPREKRGDEERREQRQAADNFDEGHGGSAARVCGRIRGGASDFDELSRVVA